MGLEQATIRNPERIEGCSRESLEIDFGLRILDFVSIRKRTVLYLSEDGYD
jgi:hypothetical protein